MKINNQLPGTNIILICPEGCGEANVQEEGMICPFCGTPLEAKINDS
jgi:hypothetical protein